MTGPKERRALQGAGDADEAHEDLRAAVTAGLGDLAVPAGVVARIARYLELLSARNAVLNLTAARDPAALIEHVRDSLTLSAYIQGPFVDVGSGGGFPAIPLAIATGRPVTLVEATAKKAAFLREALEALEISGAVVADRAERAAHDPALRERFSAATARAVGSLPTVLELTLPFLTVGGTALLQRGEAAPNEAAAAVDASLMLGGEVGDELRGEGGRRIVFVRKRAATPQRFPRRTGVPVKRPLCGT